MTTDARKQYTAGLRQLADMLDADPHVPLPFEAGTGTHVADRVLWFFHRLADFRAFVGSFPSVLVRDEAASDRLRNFPHVFFGDLAGLHVGAYCASVLDEDQFRAANAPRASVDATGRA